MKLLTHDARQYSESLKSLLPLGAVWEWSEGSFGDALVLATAQELARVDAVTQVVLDDAIELHRPGQSRFTLADYQAVADAATQIIPRKPATIGSTVGYRLWSDNAPVSVSPVPHVTLNHLIHPAAIGSRIGDKLWSASARYYLQVSFDNSLVFKESLYAALMAFKQAHVYLYINDVADLGS
jgi:hypothetical protein